MSVTKCVCYNRRFTELLPLACAQGWRTTTDISAATGCGTGCGGCRPYLEAMLATGATAFKVKQDDQPPQPCQPNPWDS
jgi:NAD(P)H-nitrite reductase large subunit